MFTIWHFIAQTRPSAPPDIANGSLSVTIVTTVSPTESFSLPSVAPVLAATSTRDTSALVTPLPTSPFTTYDPVVLAALMLELVNVARQQNGLAPVTWDTTAALAGQLHAEDMAQADYFSHWNQEGLGPDHRYTLVGGQHAVMENLHAFSYTYDNGRAAPIENWPEVIQNAHTGLMNSPGHRANILDPAHTHLGIGMAYNAETGQFRLAQEFTNQYGHLASPLPLQASPGDTIAVRGHLTGQLLSNPLLNLAYEPLPAPMNHETLIRTSTYSSAATSVTTRQVDLAFDETITLDNNRQAGFYHIRLFVDIAGEQALVIDQAILVR